MLLVDDLAAGGTKNLRHTPRGLVTLRVIHEIKLFFLISDLLITFANSLDPDQDQ